MRSRLATGSKANGLAEMVGGASYLVELANATPSAANIAAYAEIVREKSVLRQLIDAGTAITEDGYRPEGKGVQEVLESAEQRVFHIAESGARGTQRYGVDARGGERRVPPAARALPESRPAHRHLHRLHRSGQSHLGPAAVGPDHHGGASVDG